MARVWTVISLDRSVQIVLLSLSKLFRLWLHLQSTTSVSRYCLCSELRCSYCNSHAAFISVCILTCCLYISLYTHMLPLYQSVYSHAAFISVCILTCCLYISLYTHMLPLYQSVYSHAAFISVCILPCCLYISLYTPMLPLYQSVYSHAAFISVCILP